MPCRPRARSRPRSPPGWRRPSGPSSAGSALASLLADPALAGRPLVAGPGRRGRRRRARGPRAGDDRRRLARRRRGGPHRRLGRRPRRPGRLRRALDLRRAPRRQPRPRRRRAGGASGACSARRPARPSPARRGRLPGCCPSPSSSVAPRRVGDVVTTLGSVGERPYVPGIRVGTVRSVDPGVGRLAPTGTIAPGRRPDLARRRRRGARGRAHQPATGRPDGRPPTRHRLMTPVAVLVRAGCAARRRAPRRHPRPLATSARCPTSCSCSSSPGRCCAGPSWARPSGSAPGGCSTSSRPARPTSACWP